MRLAPSAATVAKLKCQRILRLGSNPDVPAQLSLISSLNEPFVSLSIVFEKLRDNLEVIDESIHLGVSTFVVACA